MVRARSKGWPSKHIGGDGATDQTIELIGFFNTGNQPCELADPLALQLMGPGTQDVEVHRRGFFPMVPFVGPLQPGERAVIGVETPSCDPTEEGISVPVEGVTFVFPEVSISLPLELEGACGVAWDGFRVWD